MKTKKKAKERAEGEATSTDGKVDEPETGIIAVLSDPEQRPIYILSFLYYFGYGIHLAYDNVFAWTYLQTHGVSHTTNSVIRSVLYIPYILKIIIAITADKYRIWMPGVGSGHRKPYILIGIILNFTGMFMCGFVDPSTNLTLYGLLQFLDMAGIAIADTNMDAILIEMTESMDKTLFARLTVDAAKAGKFANSEAQVQATVGVGTAVGTAFGAVAFAPLMQNKGSYQTYFFLCATVFAAFMLISLPFASEPEEEEDESSTRKQFKWEAFSLFWDGEFTRTVWAVLWYTFFGRLGAGILAQLLAPILEEKTLYAYKKEETGSVIVLMGFMFTCGSGIAGLLSFEFGFSLTSSTVGSIIGLALVAILSSLALLFVGIVLVGLSGGVIGVLTSAVLMILSEPEINASFFSIAMIVQNCGNIVSRLIAGPLVDSGKDKTGKIILSRSKASRALWVAVGFGVISLFALPTIWTGLNRRVEKRDKDGLEEKEHMVKGGKGPTLNPKNSKGSNDAQLCNDWPDMFTDEEEGRGKTSKKRGDPAKRSSTSMS